MSKRTANPANSLGQIDHIVVVMLENRSFDHMLGFLYAGNNNVSPLGHPFDGLTGKESNPDGKGKPVPVFKIKSADKNAYFMPGADPGEGYLETNGQLYGSTTAPASNVAPANQGFVTNYIYTLGWESKEAGRVLPGTTPSMIMGMFPPEMLPVLSGLAKGYAVCDQWFSSAPTETFPNRAFVSMATSQGHLADKTCSVFTAPSIYTALEKNGQTWAGYGYDAMPLLRGSVADITHALPSRFGKFPDFQQAVKSGTLANYVFLEPQWGTKGNSQHPNYDVSLGEQFLHDVYYTLFGSKLWESTLLIITYDEHGGCYDHVPPPSNAVPPDNSVGEFGFDFKRFGLRVPTVLVSPLIAAGTVYRATGPTPQDHTSILATAEKRFGIPPLTKRDAAAPDVGSVLTLAKARTDDPLKGVAVPKSIKAPALPNAPTHLEQAVVEHAAHLPVPEKGKNGARHQAPPLKTGKAATAYVNKRYQRYDDSRNQK